MPSVLIDLPEDDLQAIEKMAKANFRSRKAQIELMVDLQLIKEMSKK